MISVSQTPSIEHHQNRQQHSTQKPSSTTVGTNVSDGVNAHQYPVDVPRTWPLDLLEQFDDPSTAIAATMQSDAWGSTMPQFTPKMGRVGNHQRESSLSSLGSTGPASPFNPNTSNPHIAVTTDSGSDGLDLQAADPSQYYQIAKSMGPYQGYHNLDAPMPEMAYPVTIPGPGANGNLKTERSLLPAPDFGNGSTRSHPTSVASSIAGDSPATPTINDPEAAEKRRKAATYGNVPKLDRTMTDIYGDELYNPNFAITSTSPSQPQLALSPTNDVFSQRLNAANSQHLGSGQSPVTSNNSGDRSPFRTGSPMAAMSATQDLGAPRNNVPRGMHFSSAQRLREQNQVRHEAQMQQQMVSGGAEPETPKTISPKDAILEFSEPEGDRNFPLFPTEATEVDQMDQFTKAMMPQAVSTGLPNGAQFNYMASGLPTAALQLNQQYSFMPHPSNDTPPRLSSAGSSTGESGGSTPVGRTKPLGATADGGTYTCTYHGCTLRFETPALLQKHKREGHRQAQGLGAPRPPVPDVGMTSSLIGSQAGPHRCNRINPSTGKPCSTVFSRPYDLTRHEDTIHNARKQKVRCDLCTEEKTFSRADALTRHYRVCHPEAEVPGKRRRG